MRLSDPSPAKATSTHHSTHVNAPPHRPRQQASSPLISSSNAPPPRRLQRKDARDERHDAEQRRAEIHRHRGGRVSERGDNDGHDAHDAVERDGRAVACRAVRRRDHFGRVRVERAVVLCLRVSV